MQVIFSCSFTEATATTVTAVQQTWYAALMKTIAGERVSAEDEVAAQESTYICI